MTQQVNLYYPQSCPLFRGSAVVQQKFNPSKIVWYRWLLTV